MKWERREGVTTEDAFKRACERNGIKIPSGNTSAESNKNNISGDAQKKIKGDDKIRQEVHV
ncbi:MAG: hypothetical protein FWG83_05495 [Oscillospiraceae bacterium]|nr:hypothetical protein [Oscillospiraceae bacterium]